MRFSRIRQAKSSKDDSIAPVALKQRRIPFHIRKKVDDAINRRSIPFRIRNCCDHTHDLIKSSHKAQKDSGPPVRCEA